MRKTGLFWVFIYMYTPNFFFIYLSCFVFCSILTPYQNATFHKINSMICQFVIVLYILLTVSIKNKHEPLVAYRTRVILPILKDRVALEIPLLGLNSNISCYMIVFICICSVRDCLSVKVPVWKSTNAIHAAHDGPLEWDGSTTTKCCDMDVHCCLVNKDVFTVILVHRLRLRGLHSL